MTTGKETKVLYIHAQTAVHAGSGTALGVVDLPVQRERHTHWPLIPGSALKGVLRSACREKLASQNGGDRKKANEHDDVKILFGPPTADDDAHAGSLALTDARLLAFPVRSLKGVFAWVSCRAVLERFVRDLELAQVEGLPPLPAEPGQGQVLCGDALAAQGKVILEEYDFDRKPSSEVEALARWIGERGIAHDDTRARFGTHFAILRDDDFTHFARHATEVVARIGLNYDRKTVNTGALFYQELVPAETVFYALGFASSSRNGVRRSSVEVLETLKRLVPPVVQIGGDETIGRGVCALTIC